MLKDLPILSVEEEVISIASVYIERKAMPKEEAGDAFHLALASYHKCDFMVTWNCRHLANVNKAEHIKHINTALGLFIPQLITPLELLGDEYEG